MIKYFRVTFFYDNFLTRFDGLSSSSECLALSAQCIDHISYKLEFILEETRTSVEIIVINDHSSDDPDGIFSALKM